MPQLGTTIDFAGFLSVNQSDSVHLAALLLLKHFKCLRNVCVPEQRFNDFKVSLFMMY